MALKRTLQLIQRDGNYNKIETTFKNVNPNAAPAAIKTAMLNLSNLTANTYVTTHVIDTQDLDEMVGDD